MPKALLPGRRVRWERPRPRPARPLLFSHMATSANTIVLLGGGGHALVVMEAAQAEGLACAGFYDDSATCVLSRRTGLARLGGLSLVAGIAACEALHGLGFGRVALKWPNDLVVAGDDGLRKLGGLLVEGGGEAGGAARAAIGLGLNVRMPGAVGAGIDQPWIDLAGMQDEVSRNAVVAAVLDALLPALSRFDADGLAPFLPRYAAHDALAGRGVRVHDAASTWEAQALGIADDGALRVRTGEGHERRVHAADVSVRA